MKKLLFAILAVLFLSSYIQAGEGKIAIIVNANSPLGNNISMDKVRDIYTGKIKFEGKTKIQPANQKDKGLFDEYLGKFVGMDANAYKNHWVKKVFAEGGAPPLIIGSSKDVIKYVSENDGGIGYVWEGDLTGNEGGIKKISAR